MRGWFQTLRGKATPSPTEATSKVIFNLDVSTAANTSDVLEQFADFTVRSGSAGAGSRPETQIIESAEMEENPVDRHVVEVSDTVMEDMEMNVDNGEDVVHGAGETEEIEVDCGVGQIQASLMGDTPIAAHTEHTGVEEIVDTAPFGDEDEMLSYGDGDDDSSGGGGDDDVDMQGFWGEDEMGLQEDRTDMDRRCGTRSRLYQNGLFQIQDFADGRIPCQFSCPRNSASHFRPSTSVLYPCSRLSRNGQTP